MSFPEFSQFYAVLGHVDDIKFALEIFGLSDGASSFKRDELQRAIQGTPFLRCIGGVLTSGSRSVVTGTTVSPKLLDVVIQLFSDSKEGLNLDSFVAVSHQRTTRGLDSPRDTGFVNKLSKLKECYTSL